MSLAVDFLDEPRVVPETPEQDWGDEVTNQLFDMLRAGDFAFFVDGSGNLGVRLQSVASTLADGATLTPTFPVHRVAGSGGAVTLSAITAITAGTKDGQLLILLGTSNTNTVRVLNGANTLLNGTVILGQGDVLELFWSSSLALWVERGRNS